MGPCRALQSRMYYIPQRHGGDLCSPPLSSLLFFSIVCLSEGPILIKSSLINSLSPSRWYDYFSSDGRLRRPRTHGCVDVLLDHRGGATRVYAWRIGLRGCEWEYDDRGRGKFIIHSFTFSLVGRLINRFLN